MNFCLLLKIWVKILIQNIDNNLSDKYSGKILDHTKESATDALKLISKTAIQKQNKKTPEASEDLSGNKIADRITKVSKTSQQINSETVISENDKEIPKKGYISPEEGQKIN